MTDVMKLLLVMMLPLPFIALYHDARRGTKFMIPTLSAVIMVSTFICFFHGGFHQRPRVSALFSYAFVIWPVALLLALKISTQISWRTAWISVPLMSWYTVNLSMQFWYPTDGGGGGLGYGLALVAGWLYMIPTFAIASGAVVMFCWISHRCAPRNIHSENK